MVIVSFLYRLEISSLIWFGVSCLSKIWAAPWSDFCLFLTKRREKRLRTTDPVSSPAPRCSQRRNPGGGLEKRTLRPGGWRPGGGSSGLEKEFPLLGRLFRFKQEELESVWANSKQWSLDLEGGCKTRVQVIGRPIRGQDSCCMISSALAEFRAELKNWTCRWQVSKNWAVTTLLRLRK